MKGGRRNQMDGPFKAVLPLKDHSRADVLNLIVISPPGFVIHRYLRPVCVSPNPG